GVPAIQRPRLFADDGMAIWRANPGDVLPDGTVARALHSGQPVDYPSTAPIVDDVLQLAGSEGLLETITHRT
ncbi:hypothetical protein NO136_20690, partial [Clostridioides difficile]|nr:hypothetical protein [Clostridioides difficile]